MEEGLECSPVSEGVVRGIKFTVATSKEICTYSVNDCPISHPSQLANPFLGLPLETGKCESCGTAEAGQCEGQRQGWEIKCLHDHMQVLSEHFERCGSCIWEEEIELLPSKDLPALSIKIATSDGTSFIELSVSARTNMREGFWNFLNKFGGFRTSEGYRRPLLPVEALNILKEIPEETRKRMSAKGYFPQDGYILQYLVVPPNCLLVPEISDGKSIMCADVSRSLLKRVLSKIDHIKRSRSGNPNFEAHLAESNDLQLSIAEYMQLRGMTKRTCKGIGRERRHCMFMKCGRSLPERFKLFDLYHILATDHKTVARIAKEAVEDFAAENVVYLELRTTPKNNQAKGMTKRSYLEAVIKGLRAVDTIDVSFIASDSVIDNTKKRYHCKEENICAPSFKY